MAITYPLNQPTSIGIASISIRAQNATKTSESPFTYKQQVVAHTGQRWEATVEIPPVHRDLAADWKAMLVALKGNVGTFLLGDPDYSSPRGTVSSCTLTGNEGDDTVSVTMTGSLLAGDYIQLGSGASARLHTVLVDQTGTGNLEIWPALRANYTSEAVVYTDPKGVFRLRTPITEWSINNAGTYGISFDAVEVLT